MHTHREAIDPNKSAIALRALKVREALAPLPAKRPTRR
jgi:hypothetical protein